MGEDIVFYIITSFLIIQAKNMSGPVPTLEFDHRSRTVADSFGQPLGDASSRGACGDLKEIAKTTTHIAIMW
jgi:hypothetical protein